MKLPLSKTTIEKLSTADKNAIIQFLKSLKYIVDEFEHKKQLKLENEQNCPVYIIMNDDMVQVSGKIIYVKVLKQYRAAYINYITFI